MSDLNTMSTKEKIIWIAVRYGLCAVFGGFLCWFVLWVNDFGEVTDELMRLKLLADCTTSPGVILILLGALIWVSQQGALDFLGFGLKYMFRSFLPGGRLAKRETYLEYVQNRAAKEKVHLGPFFIVGGIFLAVSIIFIIQYVQLEATM